MGQWECRWSGGVLSCYSARMLGAANGAIVSNRFVLRVIESDIRMGCEFHEKCFSCSHDLVHYCEPNWTGSKKKYKSKFYAKAVRIICFHDQPCVMVF